MFIPCFAMDFVHLIVSNESVYRFPHLVSFSFVLSKVDTSHQLSNDHHVNASTSPVSCWGAGSPRFKNRALKKKGPLKNAPMVTTNTQHLDV